MVSLLADLGKDLTELFLQSVRDGIDAEVVGTEAAAILVAEMLFKQVGKRLQHLVALGEAVFAVVVLHAAEIHVEHRHRAAAGYQRSAVGVRELKEIGHTGQSCQIIVVTGVEQALIVQCAAERVIERLSAAVSLSRIAALVRVPDIGETDAVVGVDVLADRMHDLVSIRFIGVGAVDHLIPAALRRETERRVRHSGCVVGMGSLIHIVIHHVVGIRLVVEFEQLAKAVGQHDGDHPLVDELINGERHAQLFQRFLCRSIKPVSIHFDPPSQNSPKDSIQKLP